MTDVSNNVSVRAQYNTLMGALDQSKNSRLAGELKGHTYVSFHESGLAGTAISKEKAASTTDIFKNAMKLMHSPELTAAEKLNLKNRVTSLLKEKENSLSFANTFKQALFLLKGSSLKEEKQLVQQQLRELEAVSIQLMSKFEMENLANITIEKKATDPAIESSQSIDSTGKVVVSTSTDKTVAFIHDSTSPKANYLPYKAGEKGLNMDRMGYAQSMDGTKSSKNW